MKARFLVLAAMAIGGSALMQAQAPVPDADGVIHLTDGASLQTQDVMVDGAEAYVNTSLGKMNFVGPVKVRPARRPLTTEIPATNLAGVPFPKVDPVVMHVTGKFEIAIGKLVLRADEADINNQTGEMELRGNVSATLPPTPVR